MLVDIANAVGGYLHDVFIGSLNWGILIGYVAQSLFAMRFVVQWIASERAGASGLTSGCERSERARREDGPTARARTRIEAKRRCKCYGVGGTSVDGRSVGSLGVGVGVGVSLGSSNAETTMVTEAPLGCSVPPGARCRRASATACGCRIRMRTPTTCCPRR